MDSQYFRVGFHVLGGFFDLFVGHGSATAGIAGDGVEREHISAGFLFEIPLLQRFKRRVDRLELVSLFGQAVDELDIDELEGVSELIDEEEVMAVMKNMKSKAVTILAVPTIAASLVMVIYNLADTFFVGALNNPIATSAVSLAAPVVLAFNAVTNLFGVGASSMMSRSLGVRDYDTVKKTSVFGIYCGLICGLLFSLIATFFKGGLLKILGADVTNITKTSEYLFWTVTCGAIPSILNVIMGNY